MPIHAAIAAARHHREELVYGALTGLLSCHDAPLNVQLPRLAGSMDATQSSHFGQTIPQDTPTLLEILDRLEAGVDDLGEFDEATGNYLYWLGSSFRRHGLDTQHYAPLSDAICTTLERHLGEQTGLASLKGAVYLACNIMAHGCQEANDQDARDPEANPLTARATILEVEDRNATMKVVRLQMDPPLKYAVGEPLMARTPYAPLLWRPVYSSLPSNPDGLIEVHISCGVNAGNLQRNCGTFFSTIIGQAQPGDEWVLSPQATNEFGAPMGLHFDDPQWAMLEDQDVILIAEGAGLAPARAAIMQQVMGGKVGATPRTYSDDFRPDDIAGRTRGMHLFWGAQNPGELYELQGLLGLTNAFDWLRFTPVVEQYVTPMGTNPTSAAGLPDAEKDTHVTNTLLTKGDVVSVALSTSRDLPNKTFIVAGPRAMIDHAMQQLTADYGVPQQQIIPIPLRPV